MSIRSVARLAAADLSLNRNAALAYAATAITGAALARFPNPALRGLGISLVLCVLIGECFHLPIVTVFQDALRGTRALTLSLPVTPAEYAAGKLLADALLFLIPAGAAVAAELAAPASQRLFPPALVLLVLLGGLIFFVQNLGIALVSESMGASMVCLLGQLFVLGNVVPLFARRSTWCLRVWSGLEEGGPIRTAAFALLTAELALTIGVTMALMTRKRRLI